MIKNEKQYEISKKYLQQVKDQIDRIKSDSTSDPIRKQLHLAPLIYSTNEVEESIFEYEERNKR